MTMAEQAEKVIRASNNRGHNRLRAFQAWERTQQPNCYRSVWLHPSEMGMSHAEWVAGGRKLRTEYHFVDGSVWVPPQTWFSCDVTIHPMPKEPT